MRTIYLGFNKHDLTNDVTGKVRKDLHEQNTMSVDAIAQLSDQILKLQDEIERLKSRRHMKGAMDN